MKKIILFLCLATAMLNACSDGKKINPKLALEVENMNKQCPIQIDPVSILVGMEALPGNTLKYNYKISTKSDISDTTMAKNVFGRKILYGLKNNPQIKGLLAMKINFLHSYSDINGKHLFETYVTAEDYNKTLPEQSLAQMIQDAVWFNKLLLPSQLDEITVWTDSRFVAPDTFLMVYDLDESKINRSDLEIPMLKEMLIKNTKTDKSAQEIKDKGGIFKHVYRTTNGDNIEIVITPDDYR